MTNGAFDKLFGGPPRQPESDADPTRDGSRRVGPGGDRGDHAAHGAPRAPRDRHGEPLPRRRRRAQLRRQRPPAARRRRSSVFGSSPRPATPVARSGSRSRSTTRCSATSATGTARALDTHEGLVPRPGVLGRRDRVVPEGDRRGLRAASRPTRMIARTAEALADEKVVGWLQGRMEFGPRSLGVPQHPRRPALAEDAVDHEPARSSSGRASGRSRRACSASTSRTTSISTCDSPYMLLVAPVQRVAPHRDDATSSSASSASTS